MRTMGSIRWIRFRADRIDQLTVCAFTCVSPQPFLASEKRAKRDGDLPVLIALEPNSLAIRGPKAHNPIITAVSSACIGD